uniref:Uncharacterized protein n=1 Tax=Photinus pyralis TaxID=7054 RepID=A0A1Y1KVK0_PHOPY
MQRHLWIQISHAHKNHYPPAQLSCWIAREKKKAKNQDEREKENRKAAKRQERRLINATQWERIARIGCDECDKPSLVPILLQSSAGLDAVHNILYRNKCTCTTIRPKIFK